MCRPPLLGLALVACATALTSAAADDPARNATTAVVINITGNGPGAKYVKEGDPDQRDVELVVGQKVRWVNKGNTTHTATSDRVGGDGNPLFQTGILRRNQASADIEFTQQMYDAAGGMPGGQVSLDYYCEFHAVMRARILLRSSRQVLATPTRAATYARKSVHGLTDTEVANLREAFRRLQANGEYNRQVRLHQSAEHNNTYFLPWHRAYLLGFENKLRAAVPGADPPVSLPYWNYDRPEREYRELPEPFRPRTVGGRPNPLFLGRYQGWSEGTRQLDYGAVRFDRILTLRTYESFWRGLNNGPHNYVHNNIGRTMADITVSPTDPIFWLHHANLDRAWARWSADPGHQHPADPGWRRRPLRGFEAEPVNTAGAVLDTEALGYTYVDRLIQVDRPVAFARGAFSAPAVELPVAPTGRVVLRLDGIPVPRTDNLTGRVYLKRAEAADPDDRPGELVGVFTVLALGQEGQHDPTTDVVLDVTDAVRNLAGGRAVARFALTIIPAAAEGAEVQATALTVPRIQFEVTD